MTRLVNLENMNDESIDGIIVQVSQKVSDILNKAKADSEKLLSRYGLTIDLGYEVRAKESKVPHSDVTEL